MTGIFEGCGLVEQVEGYINGLVTESFSDKWKESHSTKKYFEEFEKRYNRLLLRETNWEIYFSKNPIIELNDTIKANVTEVFDRLLEDYKGEYETVKGTNEWVNWLLNVDFLVKYMLYKTEESYKNKIFFKLMPYYKFFLEKVKEKGFLIPTPFNVNPVQRFWDNTKKRKPLPKCPHCGSEQVKKWSKWRYRCNECGRTFSKLRI